MSENAQQPENWLSALRGYAGVRTSIAGDIGAGDEILSRLADMSADLLVMGAYGHSRMRGLVFGGVTRRIAGT